jgi:Secretion system C-terminal sorting domain
MKKLLSILILVMSSKYNGAQNLITNPGFESSLTGTWNIVNGGWNQFDNGYGYGDPNSGTYYAAQGFTAPPAEMYQDINVSSYATEIDNGTKSFTASGYLQVGSNGTEARITVEFRNTGGTVLQTVSMMENISNFGVWNYKTNTQIAPAGTRSIRFRLLFVSGFDLVMFDDVSLTATTVLPLHFTIFSGSNAENTIKLEWQTENEINTKSFEIEKSNNGITYSAIGLTNAKGNNALTQQYYFTDAAPLPGNNYYRIKQIDKDGRYAYSTAIKVSTKISNNGITVYPQPAQTIMNVVLTQQPQQSTQIKLYTASGQLIKTITATAVLNVINVQSLPVGNYMMSVESGGIKQTKAISINR